MHTTDPHEFVGKMVVEYQKAGSPSSRRRVNALVTMALRAGRISEADRDRFDKEKVGKPLFEEGS